MFLPKKMLFLATLGVVLSSFFFTGTALAAGVCSNIVPNGAQGQLQGFFSTDKNFIIEGNNSCPIPDNRLLIDGGIIMNAAQAGGTFELERSLCGTNATYPVFSIEPRPDLILHAPDLIKLSNYIYTEVAP